MPRRSSGVSTVRRCAAPTYEEDNARHVGRPIPENFRITFRRDVLAEALWEYGEDELAEAALGLREDDLHQVQLMAVWHHENDADPGRGPKLTNARVMARAMIEGAEGGARDTKRTRRRTRPKEEAYDGAYHASLLSGSPLPSTPAEDGLDVHD
jgi:hypothetical protein